MTSPASTSAPLITCPSCKTKHRYSLENAYRPFCSDRCRLIDLGAWANNDYTIAGTAAPLEPTENNAP